MSGAGEGNSIEVDRLLERAAATVAKASFCWLATVDESGAPRLRPMGRLPPEPGRRIYPFRAFSAPPYILGNPCLGHQTHPQDCLSP